MECYVHDLPGRLRIKIPMLKKDSQQCQGLQQRLHGLHGVKDVAVNALTGSVLVYYDPMVLTSVEVLHTLEEHGCRGISRPATSGTLPVKASALHPAVIESLRSEASKFILDFFFGLALKSALRTVGLSFLAAAI